jgi:hypothetical protein
MKNLILVSLMLFSLETLYGQGFKVGLRTGINNWKEYRHAYKSQEYCWEKEVFGRYELKKWAFELSVVQYNHSVTHLEIDDRYNRDYFSHEYYGYSQFFETGLRVYYNVLPKELTKNGIKWYWGINTAIVNEKTTYTSIWNFAGQIDRSEGRRWHGAPLLLGLCSNLDIRLTKRINLNNFIGFDFYPENQDKFTNSQYSKLSARFGTSYKLN